jgi:hypothetical protein
MSSNGRSNQFKFRPVPRAITPHQAQLIASELKDRNVADVRWWLMVGVGSRHRRLTYYGLIQIGPFCLTLLPQMVLASS